MLVALSSLVASFLHNYANLRRIQSLIGLNRLACRIYHLPLAISGQEDFRRYHWRNAVPVMRFFATDIINNLSFPVPQSLQKRLINYALKKCLGPFVQRDLNSDDLDFQLREGRLTLLNVDLRLEVKQ